LAGFVFVRVLQRPDSGRRSGDPPASGVPAPVVIIAVDSGHPRTPRSRTASTPADSDPAGSDPASSAPVRRPTGPSVHTPEGMWWGVDWTLPISTTTIRTCAAG